MSLDQKISQLPTGSAYTGAELLALVQGTTNVKDTLAVLTKFWTLQGDKTLYVRKDGTDTNDGSANDSGHAFLTVQRAIQEAFKYDCAGHAIIVQVGDGTYVESVRVSGTIKGLADPGAGAKIFIRGNATTPSNVAITSATVETTGYAILADHGNLHLRVENLIVSNSVGMGNGIGALNGAFVEIGTGVNFGTCVGSHITAGRGGVVYAPNSGYAISGGAASHVHAFNNGAVNYTPASVLLSGTPAFSTGFAFAELGGTIVATGTTFTGSATGKHFSVTSGGILSTGGAGATYLPGDTAGTFASGGVWDGRVGLVSQDVQDALGFMPISGITSAMVTNALGYTPISNVTSAMVTSALGYTPRHDLGTTTVASLPAVASSQGYTALVTDSTLAASGNFGAIVAGGGTNVVKVWCDGTHWLIG